MTTQRQECQAGRVDQNKAAQETTAQPPTRDNFKQQRPPTRDNFKQQAPPGSRTTARKRADNDRHGELIEKKNTYGTSTIRKRSSLCCSKGSLTLNSTTSGGKFYPSRPYVTVKQTKYLYILQVRHTIQYVCVTSRTRPAGE